jgi:hypothetical protein
MAATGNAVEMSFTPLHWVAYWYGGNLRRMATVTVCLPSGIRRGSELDSIKPYVSMCGMFLTIKVLWPSVLANYDSMNRGWQGPNKELDDNLRLQMMLAYETKVENVCKAAKVANAGKMYAVCKIKLDFEVDRIMVDKLVLVDESNGLLLQAVLKEAKKDKDTTEHILDVVCINSKPAASGSFDLAAARKKSKSFY